MSHAGARVNVARRLGQRHVDSHRAASRDRFPRSDLAPTGLAKLGEQAVTNGRIGRRCYDGDRFSSSDPVNPAPRRELMRSDNAVRSSFVIIGLCASLTLGLSACGSTLDEGSSEPIGEEVFGGDNRDRDPAHQEMMREQR
jgi:hypothetical protein